MEHRIILGGEQYLPFARSCIAKLKRLGLAFASQHFLVGGVSIHVKITPGHEYIRIDGGGTLAMDSGVIDMGSTVLVQPATFDAGVLTDTMYSLLYHAPFALKTPTSVWRTHQGRYSQVAGTITVSSRVKGGLAVVGTDPKSFTPKTVTAPDGITQMPSSIDNQPDSILRQKKEMMKDCPASIFTGRCRAYVQAIYGQHLYDSQGEVGKYLPTADIFPGASPALRIPGAKKIEEGQANNVRIDTNTGIHLDEDGRHWMFNPVLTAVTAYPMKSDAPTSARAVMLAAGTPQEDKTKLESYILGVSRPDIAAAQKISIDMTENYGGGYGWHWNYTGLVADKVVTERVPQEPPEPGDNRPYFHMRSTHFRLTMTRAEDIDGNVVWNAAVTQVAQSNWCGPSGGLVLAEPDWKGELDKVMPRYSVLFACHATFYAYYKGDDLKLCTVTLNEVAALPERTTSTSPYYEPVLRRTQGLETASAKTFLSQQAYFTGSVTCGDLTHDGLIYGLVESGAGSEVKNKARAYTELSNISYTNPSAILVQPGDGFFIQNGSFPDYNFSFIPDSNPREPNSGIAQLDLPKDVSYDMLAFNFSRPYFSECFMVIPTGDAEAIYLRSKSSYIEYRQDVQKTSVIDNAALLRGAVVYQGGGATIWEYSQLCNYQDAIVQSSESVAPTEEETVTLNLNQASLSVGTLSVNDYSTAAFIDPALEKIPDNFLTLTSAAGEATISRSAKYAPIGTTELNIDLPGFVGWV